jgi:hypothetical protein
VREEGVTVPNHKYEVLKGQSLLDHLVAEHDWTDWDITQGRGQLEGYPESWHAGAHNVVQRTQ